MLKERLSKLLTVKSLVTLVLTGVFAFLSLRGGADQTFLTIYTTVIAFYFGTQYERKAAEQALGEIAAPPEEASQEAIK